MKDNTIINSNPDSSSERTTRYLKNNDVERVQAFINPKSEPELYAAWLYIVEHHKGKKNALANAILAEYKLLVSEAENK